MERSLQSDRPTWWAGPGPSLPQVSVAAQPVAMFTSAVPLQSNLNVKKNICVFFVFVFLIISRAKTLELR